MLVAVTYADLLSGPALLVALLSVVFLVFPCAYLYMALRERGVFRRLFGGGPAGYRGPARRSRAVPNSPPMSWPAA